ncbi:DNA-methyltransferase [Streptomyces sp. NPDC087420]|uniref:DNA-methyltransferase n=1 Tax=Streptomyces sp. NPDC087420 TaxID=3365785 RepID=UPI0038396757
MLEDSTRTNWDQDQSAEVVDKMDAMEEIATSQHLPNIPLARKPEPPSDYLSHFPTANLPHQRVEVGDARKTPFDDKSVDLIVTSPPYWQKRDYDVDGQIGQEKEPQGYVDAMMDCLKEWRRILRHTGSVFMNVGDTYKNQSLVGIPGRLEAAAIDNGWQIRNRIIWAKAGGMPEPAKSRLANRHEYIIHLTPRPRYYYDLLAYSDDVGNGSNPGDIWWINPERNMGKHLAPFPTEIVRRAVLLACPVAVCSSCGAPFRRLTERSDQLDPTRTQAVRAMQLAKEAKLTPAHIAAIQATGVSDAGKALKVQNGTGRNSAEVRALAAEAKKVLGGYFREFTFAKRRSMGWERSCVHVDAPQDRGVVLDPFMGTGTTLRTAYAMGRSALGIDLASHTDDLLF